MNMVQNVLFFLHKFTVTKANAGTPN